ncbi:TPA: hypothetical protein ACIYZ6_004903 [Escherichia coli]|uniref:IS110 family transposase n=1 Tax=Escherichia coli TaxID=562 RepID=UPI0003A26146|nr:IS110 family transposase [Escherichia coli]
MLLKLTGQIAQNAALKGSQIHWMQKMQSGACEALRIINVARRSAVKARTQAINQLRALLQCPAGCSRQTLEIETTRIRNRLH